MPDETTTWVPLADLKPWSKNARQHSDDSTRKLAAGIRRFGFLVPLTAWRAEQRIAAGHGRRLAMQALLNEDPTFVPRNAPPGTGPGMVPVMWEDFASEQQFEAFAVSDNRQAKNATDDRERLAEILRDLDEHECSFDGMGFDDEEIEKALQLMPELDLDDLDEDFELPDSEGVFKFFALVPNEDAAEVKAAIDWWKEHHGLPKAHRTEQVVGQILLHWWREIQPAYAAAAEAEHAGA